MRKKANRRKRPSRSWKMPVVPLREFLLSSLGAAMVVVLGVTAVFVLDRPLQTLTVEAPGELPTPSEIRAAIGSRVSGGFLSVDMAAVKRSVEGLPWVDRAQVSRRWPHGLHVRVTEQIPIASWGEDGLLNRRGELFVTDLQQLPGDLPRLDGPTGSEARVARMFLVLLQELDALDLRVDALHLDPRGAWTLSLADGPEVRFGRLQVKDRIRRFVKLAGGTMASRLVDCAYIDMRYSNGFAVGWAGQTQPPQENSDGKEANV